MIENFYFFWNPQMKKFSSEIRKQDVKVSTSFPPFNHLPIFRYFLNLDNWWNYKKFNNCVVFMRVLRSKSNKKFWYFERLNLTSLKWFWKFFSKSLFFWDEKILFDIIWIWNCYFICVIFVHFVWNLLLFSLSESFSQFQQILIISIFSE